MKWKKDEIEKAILLNKIGKRFNEISNELNKTTRSVQVKLNRLGFSENKRLISEEITCINCGNLFSGKLKDNRKFCSLSCSAEYNNKKYPKRKNFQKLSNCLYCGNKLDKKGQHKFCSKECDVKYKQNLIFNEIDNGNTSFSSMTYKKYLIFKFGNKCMKCGWNEMNPITGLIPIQLEHKDGNSENHNLNNLELLCPNCHSLTPTYGALNKGSGREKRRIMRQSKINK
jgi:hypothetical protein